MVCSTTIGKTHTFSTCYPVTWCFLLQRICNTGMVCEISWIPTQNNSPFMQFLSATNACIKQSLTIFTQVLLQVTTFMYKLCRTKKLGGLSKRRLVLKDCCMSQVCIRSRRVMGSHCISSHGIVYTSCSWFNCMVNCDALSSINTPQALEIINIRHQTMGHCELHQHITVTEFSGKLRYKWIIKAEHYTLSETYL
jgi:hypothetical protein